MEQKSCKYQIPFTIYLIRVTRIKTIMYTKFTAKLLAKAFEALRLNFSVKGYEVSFSETGLGWVLSRAFSWLFREAYNFQKSVRDFYGFENPDEFWPDFSDIFALSHFSLVSLLIKSYVTANQFKVLSCQFFDVGSDLRMIFYISKTSILKANR